MRIAYFGFAANPPHRGHLEVIEWLAERYDKVLVGPSVAHAFGKNMQPLAERKVMVTALLSQVQSRNVELVEVEEMLAKDGPVYSYDVLVALQVMYPEDQLFLAVGPDNGDPAVWNRFHKADQILSEFGRVVAPNMGDHKRSTEIRFMLVRGASLEELAEVATPAVAALLVGECARLYG